MKASPAKTHHSTRPRLCTACGHPINPGDRYARRRLAHAFIDRHLICDWICALAHNDGQPDDVTSREALRGFNIESPDDLNEFGLQTIQWHDFSTPERLVLLELL